MENMTDCKGCDHRRPICTSNGVPMTACMYIIDEGLPRLVPAEQCYREKVHFKPAKEFKPISFMGRRK